MATSKVVKLTTSSDETDVSTLLAGDTIFSIPYFQRSYKWKPEKIKQLQNDVLNIVDSGDSHFMGAVILHGRRTVPTDPDQFDVIDGQQRITSIFLMITAIVKTYIDQKLYKDAADIFFKYLVIPRPTKSLQCNTRIFPCKEDRKQFNTIFKTLIKNKHFSAELGSFELKLFPETGKAAGPLRNNYNSLLRFMKEQLDNEKKARIEAILSAITDSISVVQIVVNDPTNGPKIFDSLNSRQEPMTIGDLVRNEIFSKVSSEPAVEIDRVYEQHWKPFHEKFQREKVNLFDSFFFPYGLIQNPNLKKSEVYNSLRSSWDAIKEPAKIIKQLETYQDSFIDLNWATNNQAHPDGVAKLFKNLTDLGTPSSTYPFLMQLSNSIKQKNITAPVACNILCIIESFLVRRAVCGHEPTGLHAVFKRLWVDCKQKPTPTNVTAAIKKHRTVVWPDNNEFKKALMERPLYGAAITKYLLRTYDADKKADTPSDIPWIEHVLPEQPVEKWFTDFSHEEHEKLKDTWANLIPLSAEMNRSISNKEYAIKRKTIIKDSMFKSARDFAENYKNWNPKRLEARAKKLSDWALKKWQK